MAVPGDPAIVEEGEREGEKDWGVKQKWHGSRPRVMCTHIVAYGSTSKNKGSIVNARNHPHRQCLIQLCIPVPLQASEMRGKEQQHQSPLHTHTHTHTSVRSCVCSGLPPLPPPRLHCTALHVTTCTRTTSPCRGSLAGAHRPLTPACPQQATPSADAPSSLGGGGVRVKCQAGVGVAGDVSREV